MIKIQQIGVPAYAGTMLQQPITASQFRDTWSHRQSTTPERRLMVEMLALAIADLRKVRSVDPHHGRVQNRDSALDWIRSDDREWPYSFERICAELGIDASAARAELVGGEA